MYSRPYLIELYFGTKPAPRYFTTYYMTHAPNPLPLISHLTHLSHLSHFSHLSHPSQLSHSSPLAPSDMGATSCTLDTSVPYYLNTILQVCAEYEVFRDQDRFKGTCDLSRSSNGFYKAESVEECCTLCSTTIGCTSFSYGPPTCYFKRCTEAPEGDYELLAGFGSGIVRAAV
jgi:hypothetical protein